MPTNLTHALTHLLNRSLEDILGKSTPNINLTATTAQLTFLNDSASQDHISTPRLDDRTDFHPFDVANPAGPYILTQLPDAGARQVRLITKEGDRIALSNQEVIWDVKDARQFSLALDATQNTTTVTQVEILYGVTAIFTTLQATQEVTLTLTQTPQTAETSQLSPDLDQIAALAIAAIEFNRQKLLNTTQTHYNSAEYGMVAQVSNIRLVNLNVPTVNERQIVLVADMMLKATQALGDEVGVSIETVSLVTNP